VRDGVPGAEDDLCRQYEPGLKTHLAERYTHYTLAWDDKLTAARMGLIRAARTLDPKFRLMTHARGKVKDEMGRAVEEANNLERLPAVDMAEEHRESIGLGKVTPDLSLDTPIGGERSWFSNDEEGGFNHHELIADEDENVDRDRALLRDAADAVLDGREHDIYLGSLNGHEYERFAKEWGVTPQRVSQHLNRARAKVDQWLRKNDHIHKGDRLFSARNMAAEAFRTRGNGKSRSEIRHRDELESLAAGVLKFLVRHGRPVTAETIAGREGLTAEATHDCLLHLLQTGIIEQTGKDHFQVVTRQLSRRELDHIRNRYATGPLIHFGREWFAKSKPTNRIEQLFSERKISYAIPKNTSRTAAPPIVTGDSDTKWWREKKVNRSVPRYQLPNSGWDSSLPHEPLARLYRRVGNSPWFTELDGRDRRYHWRDPNFKDTHQAKIHFHERPDIKTAFDFKGPNRIQYEAWTSLAATPAEMQKRWQSIGIADLGRLQPQERKLVEAVFIEGRRLEAVAREYERAPGQFGISYEKIIKVLAGALTTLGTPDNEVRWRAAA
jgi:RNA polymerase sigma factor (sigma-70 family)